MPKEIIRDEAAMFTVEVAWGRDSSHVQIGTAVSQDNVSPATVAELVKTWDESTKEMATGLFCTLDRYKINQLIRVLRRGRDQAFGKDE